MTALVCIVAGGKAVAFAAAVFMPGWTHSVQKSQWQERWVATSQGFFLEEARVQDSGAGMEPGEDACREGGWWVWTRIFRRFPSKSLQPLAQPPPAARSAITMTAVNSEGGNSSRIVLQHCDRQRP